MGPKIAAPDQQNEPDLRHNSALDGIRGLAILLVLIHHLVVINASKHSLLYTLARHLLVCTFCGVDIFFALSGFLITRILMRTVDDPHYFRSFYARRSLRIFPLYYGVLFLLLALTPVLHIPWGGQQWRLLTYSNRLFSPRTFTDWTFYFGPALNLVNFWSLAVEEQFYIVWPLFVFLIRPGRRLLAFALSASAVALGLRLWMYSHGFSQPYLHSALICRMDGLLLGGCLAIALITRYHDLALRIATPLFWTGLVAFAVVYTCQQIPPTQNSLLFYPLDFTCLALSSTGLIAMCLKPRSRAARLFRHPFLRFFGKYSYGLYVFHTVLPTFGFETVMATVRAHIHPTVVANLLNTCLEIVVTIGISMLSFYFFESPFLKLKRFFQPQSTAPQPAVVSTPA